jgi:sortase A
VSYDPPPPPRGGQPGQPPRAPRPRPYASPQQQSPSPRSPDPHVARDPGLAGRPGGRARGQSAPSEPTQFARAVGGSLPPPPPPPPPPQRPRPRPVDPATEVIPRVDDEYDDYDEYEDYEDDYYYDEDDAEPEPPLPPESAARKTVRGIGELLITAGLVVLLFVVYEVYVTDWISAGKQGQATEALDDQWNKDSNTVQGADPQRQEKYDLIDGKAFAKMYVPVFGTDYHFAIVEGTTDKNLEVGPGHYVGTALPGSPGNFAVAGHRVGKGAPFNDLDLLGSCDAIVVETQTGWFVYRVLPMANEESGWAEGKAKSPKCAGIVPLKESLGASYAQTTGQEIVSPSQGEVINAVPHVKGEVPAAQQAKLMTLTTCHPRFSDRQRLIVHAVMTAGYPKQPGFVPAELKEQ